MPAKLRATIPTVVGNLVQVMAIPFVDRSPTEEETELFRVIMSTYTDGSGQERDRDLLSRPGWRELERVVATALGGYGFENKGVFDVLINDDTDASTSYGISVKSKELGRATAIADLAASGRVYLELSNSPAKLWQPLRLLNIDENDFSQKRHAQEIGTSILATISSWHVAFKERFEAENRGRRLDLLNSIHLTISYSKCRNGNPRYYQIHAFGLDFPEGIEWSYSSNRCLTGMDPDGSGEPLIHWYALSGGQVKYYPRARNARHSSRPFELLQAPELDLRRKAARYWPEIWARAGGSVEFTPDDLAQELKRYRPLFSDDVSNLITEFAKKLESS